MLALDPLGWVLSEHTCLDPTAGSGAVSQTPAFGCLSPTPTPRLTGLGCLPRDETVRLLSDLVALSRAP